MNLFRKEPEKTSSVSATATGGSFANVGNISGSTIHLQTAQNVDMKDFQELLSRFRQELQAEQLDAAMVRDVDAEARGVQEQSEREKPSAALILGKLKTITDVLSSATGAGEKLVPMARQLGEMASSLF